MLVRLRLFLTDSKATQSGRGALPGMLLFRMAAIAVDLDFLIKAQ